jgi:ferredoxin
MTSGANTGHDSVGYRQEFGTTAFPDGGPTKDSRTISAKSAAPARISDSRGRDSQTAKAGDGDAMTTDALRVWVDQDLCTGDGLCVQYAPEVFEFDIDGLAYVKDGAGQMQLTPGSRADVPAHLHLEVIDAAKECPGDCIHVLRSSDDVEVAGPDAQD